VDQGRRQQIAQVFDPMRRREARAANGEHAFAQQASRLQAFPISRAVSNPDIDSCLGREVDVTVLHPDHEAGAGRIGQQAREPRGQPATRYVTPHTQDQRVLL